MKFFIIALLLPVVGFIGFLAWASYPWNNQEKRMTPEVYVLEPETMVDVDENPSVLKVLTWNIGFLFGKGSEGPGYSLRESKYFQTALEQMAKEIKLWDADILFLQEVDFNSHRSRGFNQARELARKAGYPYIAEAISWKVNYVPFPFWPLQNNFGRISSGGAILSRYPLESHEVTLLSKPASHPWWYNLFYLHRYFQKVTVEIGTKKFDLINLHLEAFDHEDRQKQVEKLVDTTKTSKLDLIAGDFNMVPEVATEKRKFFNDDNYGNDQSATIMKKSQMLEVIPDEIYLKNELTYFTFPAWAPDRRLDYIFYRTELKMIKAEVLPSALSDHLPVRASFLINKPEFNPYSQ